MCEIYLEAPGDTFDRWIKISEFYFGKLFMNQLHELFDTKDLARFTDDERASYKKYGYRYTGDAYAPHMTLGRAPEDVALDLVRTASQRVVLPKEWVFDRLSVYVMGQHGAHAETLFERPLVAR